MNNVYIYFDSKLHIISELELQFGAISKTVFKTDCQS